VSRFLYWTILIGDEPTAFRAAEAADLKPTLVQLQRTHPEARLRWFERGRLWSSPDEAQAARLAERSGARRPSTWRPGGKHVDPRQKYKDAKKAKWTQFKQGIRRRTEERRGERPPAAARSFDERPKKTTAEILADWKPPSPKTGPKTTDVAGDRRPPVRERTRDTKPDAARSEKPRSWGSKPDAARSDKPRPWGSKPAGPRSDAPRPWGSKPPTSRSPESGARSYSSRPKPPGSTFDRSRSPRPRTRDDRGPRKPRKD
jgi:hypothetical protein